MTSPTVKQFDRELDKLVRRRTHWIRSQVRKPSVGRPPTFSRKHVDRAIRHLSKLIAASLLRRHAVQALEDIYDAKKRWHVTRGKGWGTQAKRKHFLRWYDAKNIDRNCVYVFWSDNRCRYVGRTLNGKNRPQSHFHKDWFRGVTRIDIYHSKNKRNIPKLECLATHRFKPRHSKIKPSRRKWYSRCPICEAQRMVRNDVRLLFRVY